MGGLQDWKKKVPLATSQDPAPQEKLIKRQIAAAAGTEYFENRDPIYHITEDFQKTFDLMGSQKARERSAMLFQSNMSPVTPGLSSMEGEENANPGRASQERTTGDIEQERAQARFGEQSSMDRLVEPSQAPGDQMFLSRFTQMAFQRGTMAGAVLRGTGKMMLFSCLKRTVGQSQPLNFRQRKLFESSSPRRNVAGHPPDQVMFNRSQVDGAVGLVVDVLRDARRVVDTMADLASGENALPGGSGTGTLQKMYPFLSDEKEQALLSQYQQQLAGAQDVESKAILQHAIVKTQALIDKKQQMKQRFIVALRSVSDSAGAALAEFTQPGFAQELLNGLEEDLDQPEPPDDGGDGPLQPEEKLE